MGEQHRGVGTAKGIAGENGSVEFCAGEGLQRNGVGETRSRAADRAGNRSTWERWEGNGKFHQSTTTEGVTETSFPADERCDGKLPGDHLRFEPPGLQRAGTVALDPDPSATGCGGDGRSANRKTSAVWLVGGEMKHLVMQGVRGQPDGRGLTRQHRKSGAVTEANGSCFTPCVRRWHRTVQNLQAVKSSGHKWTDEIEREHQHAIRQSRVQQPCGVHQAEGRGATGVRENMNVLTPTHLAPQERDTSKA